MVNMLSQQEGKQLLLTKAPLISSLACLLWALVGPAVACISHCLALKSSAQQYSAIDLNGSRRVPHAVIFNLWDQA